jgi:hypothetical protein
LIFGKLIEAERIAGVVPLIGGESVFVERGGDRLMTFRAD